MELREQENEEEWVGCANIDGVQTWLQAIAARWSGLASCEHPLKDDEDGHSGVSFRRGFGPGGWGPNLGLHHLPPTPSQSSICPSIKWELLSASPVMQLCS